MRNRKALGSQRNRSVRNNIPLAIPEYWSVLNTLPVVTGLKSELQASETLCIFVMSTNAVVRRIVSRLSRKHVRQDKPDHPGYEVETQKYF